MSGIAFGSEPTNIFCKAENMLRPVQLYCGGPKAEIASSPLILASITNCTRLRRSAVLSFEVDGVSVEVKDPNYPHRVTLGGVEITCQAL